MARTDDTTWSRQTHRLPLRRGGDSWRSDATAEAWERAQKIIERQRQASAFSRYQDDPVGFGTEVLGDRFVPDVVRVMESVRDYPITIAKSGNSVGKSHASARIAAWFYSVFPDAKVYLAAAPPIDNLKKILWGELHGIVERSPHVFSAHDILSMQIARSKQSFITGVTIPSSGTPAQRQAKFSGKHAPHLLFILDEGDAIPQEVYAGIESCMSGGYARLLVMFNPRHAAGPVYQMEKIGRAHVVELSALRHPNVTTGTEVIPGAVDRNITVRRINEWTRRMQAEENDTDTFELPPFLVGEVGRTTGGKAYPPLKPGIRKITDPAFSYMVLGRYPAASAAQLVSSAWVEQARLRWDLYVARFGEVPPTGVQPIMGLDAAELGTDYNVAFLRYGGYVQSAILWSGVDPYRSAEIALGIYRDHHCTIAQVDGTGAGSGIAPAMVRMGKKENTDVRAFGVKVGTRPQNFIQSELGEFYLLRDQLWWATREWLRTDENAMLPPDPMLLEELRTPEYEVGIDGKIRVTDKDTLRDLLRRSPDRADALCLTFSPYERAKIRRINT